MRSAQSVQRSFTEPDLILGSLESPTGETEV